MDQSTDPKTSVASAEGDSAAARVPAQVASRASHERVPETRYRRYATNLQLWRRNRDWWRSELGAGMKLRYYADMTASYARCARGRDRVVRYLDRDFAFDNIATPLNLQTYPREVGGDVLGNLRPGFRVRSVLDVGGNLGQFAVTLRHFVPEAEVDVFEPNGLILPQLEANTASLQGVRVWPYALSPHPVDEMYFDPGRSATGSVLADQVDAIGTPRRVAVRSVSDPSTVTGNQEYDLVKIDVEGYELEVLKCLGGMTVHYLYVEMSGVRGVYPHSELLMLVRRQFGDFRVVFQGPCDRRSVNHPLLLEFAG
ncbi:FkbM family methyltransferase [Yinghuangia soli]|uniref:FkbM family methyltransferase n=1 Tax=Yinghuangia soli TaxID=2908204 RepID=A0AA41U059_9ACTN|nr:FkbM family methyltransferase [Yinghuangia soli]MCF2528241.1 FkbM family methyltransferase [Yinghuangia soli]